MRKLLLLAVLALPALVGFAESHAAENKVAVLRFRHNRAAFNQPRDSSSVNFATLVSVASSETTVALSTGDWDFDSPTGIAGTTSQPVARLFIAGTSAFAGDSLYYAVDGSADNTNWLAGTLTGLAPVTAGDKVMNAILTTDSDAAAANLWRMPFVRIRLQGDSGGVGNFGVQVKIAYPGHSR